MNCPRISRLTAPNVMVLFITFLLFSVSANAFAASQSRAYNLNQRPAADVAAQIRDLYEEVNVTVVGQKIVARGDARHWTRSVRLFSNWTLLRRSCASACSLGKISAVNAAVAAST